MLSETHAASPVLAWGWAGAKPESEGQLRFYTPDQVAALKRHVHSALDAAIYTLATEAGPRMSEIRGLKVRNVDFDVGVVRLEDGFTTRVATPATRAAGSARVPIERNVPHRPVAVLQGRPADALVFEQELKPVS